MAAILYALGIRLFQTPEVEPIKIPQSIETLAQERLQAKQAKDWEKADDLRKELTEQGWQILDQKDGYDLKPL